MKFVDRLDRSALDRDSYRPRIFRLDESDSYVELTRLLDENPGLIVIDEMESHLRELVKSLRPWEKIKPEDYPRLIEAQLAGKDIRTYGVWVYYPWSNKLVHLLDEEEFVEVRTNRNRYKITQEEQETLRGKKIGVIGLSVGQSIALTLAMERACGELRLADFDTAELSNLNRIRTGVHNLGVKKTVIAAREIAEIDPFLRVRIFSDGITDDNMDAFFGQDEDRLDLLVEVCDGLDIKIASRYRAKQLGIPVVMDTNDRGMLDIERFDLEPERPLLHGLAEGLDPDNIRDLSNEEKIPFILKMVGADKISTRLKASMMEVEQSINTWPQLASSVTLGGAITTDVCRRILLDQFHQSGRYYIDLDELIGSPFSAADSDRSAASDRDPDSSTSSDRSAPSASHLNPYPPLTPVDMQQLVERYFDVVGPSLERTEELPEANLEQIIDAMIAAPSAGNNQPWKVWYERGLLFLFHDKYRSHSWGDYYEMGAHMGLGAALENIHLQALALNMEVVPVIFPLPEEPRLIAVIRFEPRASKAPAHMIELSQGIYRRCTNRRNSVRQPLPTGIIDELSAIAADFPGFKLFDVNRPDLLTTLGEVIASCDRIRLLHEAGHAEFYSEVRWDKDHARQTRDGIELAAVDVTESEKAGFHIASDWRAVELLAQWDKGQAFKKSAIKSVHSASAMLLITSPAFSHERLLEAGRLVQRIWIHLNSRGVSVHPMLSPAFFFNRLIHGNGVEIPDPTQDELRRLRATFKDIFPMGSGDREVFLMKLSIADNMEAASLRLSKNDIFFRPHVKGTSL